MEDRVENQKPLTILYAEDNLLNQMYIKAIWDRWYFNTIIANNGAEALKILSERGHEVDLVLTDIAMPEMNWEEFAQTLRDQNFDKKIIAYTAYTVYTHNFQRELFDAILTKPTPITKLLETFDHHRPKKSHSSEVL